MTEVPLRVLSIAGSDPTGGAGVQADLKTFAAHGAYGLTAITAITVQNTHAVLTTEILDPDLVERQIVAVWEDIGVDAVKIGMLASREHVLMLAACLGGLSGLSSVPIVLDPVLQSSDGTEFLAADARDDLLAELFPLADVVTPNTLEAAVLLGRSVATEAEQRQAALALGEHARSVVVTGGHRETEDVVDLLSASGMVRVFRSERLDVRSAHGTGCALSSSIAVHLGRDRRTLNHFATFSDRRGL